MKIYIKNFKRTKKTTVLSLLCYFFRISDNFELSKKYSMYTVIETPATFKDKNFTKMQCLYRKRRSFEDIVDICKTYFPNVTDKKIAQTLNYIFKQSKEKHNQNFGFLFCTDVKKWVLVAQVSSDSKILYCYNYNNCTDFPNKKEYTYSLIDILKLMGYTKEQYTINVNS